MKAGCSAIFDNDTAQRWARSPVHFWDVDLLVDALGGVLCCRTSNIDVISAQRALAACEIIGRAQGGDWERSEYTSNPDCWLEVKKPQISPRVARMAVATIDYILSEPSEILSVWRRGGVYTEWIEIVQILRSRIRI